MPAQERTLVYVGDQTVPFGESSEAVSRAGEQSGGGECRGGSGGGEGAQEHCSLH